MNNAHHNSFPYTRDSERARENTRRSGAHPPSGRPVRRTSTQRAQAYARARTNPQGNPQKNPQRNHKNPPAQAPRVKAAKKDYTLLIFEGFGRALSTPRTAFRNFRKTKYFPQVSMVFIAVMIIISGLFALNFATRPNALEVYIAGESLGIMRWSRGELDPNYLETHTLTRLQTTLGTDVFPQDDIVATPTRAGRNAETVTFDTMVTNIEQALNFYVDAAVIYVNGVRQAILPNAALAQDMLRSIIYTYSNGYNELYDFTENVSIARVLTHKSELQTESGARGVLTTPRVVQQIHIVRAGDSLYSIARNFGMSLTHLLAVNPDIDPDATLRQSTLITVTPNIPILSVSRVN